SVWSTRVPRVGAALASIERPMVLVLDDVHTVESVTANDVLSALIDYMPAGSQIVVASRSEPKLPLSRWRAHALLDEVGVDDLRLDGAEAVELLEGAGVVLGELEAAELTRRTERWPAGLYLAALSLGAGEGDASRLETFTGEDRFVSDYLRSELLSRMPDAEAGFLTRTSVLEAMGGGLCDVVLELDGAAAVLESLERSNGFVVSLDSRREWYRYHHLFGELLRAELGRRDPKAGIELQRRALGWFVGQGRFEEALPYA